MGVSWNSGLDGRATIALTPHSNSYSGQVPAYLQTSVEAGIFFIQSSDRLVQDLLGPILQAPLLEGDHLKSSTPRYRTPSPQSSTPRHRTPSPQAHRAGD